ncbi:Uncharacterised protein [Candidatus Norongarragalina meridionalis]|nr:Uncharacterised protein [Candidatus Norongarragalina meridionalis]
MREFALAGLLLVCVAYFAYGDLRDADAQARPWMNTVILPNEVAGLGWVVLNTQERTVFATDIFSGEMMMGHTLREGTVGGDWAIIPDVVQRMNDVQYKIYGASDAKQAHEYAVKYGAKYVWVPKRMVFAGYEWKWPASVFGDTNYFKRVFDNEGVSVYEVL